jgi:hypothetical protein
MQDIAEWLPQHGGYGSNMARSVPVCSGKRSVLRGDPDLGATNEGVTVLWPLV